MHFLNWGVWISASDYIVFSFATWMFSYHNTCSKWIQVICVRCGYSSQTDAGCSQVLPHSGFLFFCRHWIRLVCICLDCKRDMLACLLGPHSDPEDRGSMFFWNINELLRHSMASYPRTYYYLYFLSFSILKQFTQQP